MSEIVDTDLDLEDVAIPVKRIFTATEKAAAAALLEERMQATFGMGHHEYEQHTVSGPIPRAYLNNAIRIVDNSGVAKQLVEWQDAARKSRAGRKALISTRGVLILFLLHVQMGHGMNYHQMANTLDHRFGSEEFELLGITDRAGDHDDWYQRLWQAAHRLLTHVDPHPTSRNVRLKPDEYAELLERQDSEGARELSERNADRLDWICERLLHTTVKMMPKDIWGRYKGNIAIDATKVEVAGLPNSPDLTVKRANADPFSGRYRREGNHDGQGAKTDVAAYELETAVMVWNKPGENTLFPSLLTAITFHRPGQLIGHGARLIKSHQGFGFSYLLVLADRAYNGEKEENFQIPARLMGCELVIDYTVTDLGKQGFYEDLILVDGNWYVRWMPEALINASKDARKRNDALKTAEFDVKTLSAKNSAKLSEDEIATLEKARKLIATSPPYLKRANGQIEARAKYRMTAKGRPDKDGFQRFTYPDPKTYAAIDPITKKKVTPSTRTSITIPLLVPEGKNSGNSKSDKKGQPVKHLQKFAHGLEEWRRHYGMRSLVESSNKLMKDASAEDLGNSTKRSGRGFAFNYLASALAAVSSNLRRLRAFFVKDAVRSGGKLTRLRRRKNAAGVALPRLGGTAALYPPQ
jgi:hypothetical protein